MFVIILPFASSVTKNSKSTSKQSFSVTRTPFRIESYPSSGLINIIVLSAPLVSVNLYPSGYIVLCIGPLSLLLYSPACSSFNPFAGK